MADHKGGKIDKRVHTYKNKKELRKMQTAYMQHKPVTYGEIGQYEPLVHPDDLAIRIRLPSMQQTDITDKVQLPHNVKMGAQDYDAIDNYLMQSDPWEQARKNREAEENSGKPLPDNIIVKIIKTAVEVALDVAVKKANGG